MRFVDHLDISGVTNEDPHIYGLRRVERRLRAQVEWRPN